MYLTEMHSHCKLQRVDTQSALTAGDSHLGNVYLLYIIGTYVINLLERGIGDCSIIFDKLQ